MIQDKKNKRTEEQFDFQTNQMKFQGKPVITLINDTPLTCQYVYPDGTKQIIKLDPLTEFDEIIYIRENNTQVNQKINI